MAQNVEFNCNWAVEVDGVVEIKMETCELPEIGRTLKETRTGSDKQNFSTSTGLLEAIDIPFGKHIRRGEISDIKVFWDWWKAGDTDKRDGAIIMLDQQGNEVYRHPFYSAICSRIKPPSFNSEDESEPATFTFTLRVEDIDMEI